MKFILLILGLVGGSILFIGCSDNVIPDQETRLGFQFFPLEQGLFRIYDVQRVDFTLVGRDTSHFQLKEVVVDSFLNVENDFTYIINREVREDSTFAWELDSVWTARRTEIFAVSVENNVSFIKLVFPVKDSVEWDANSLSARESSLFRFKDAFQSYTLGENIFDNSVTVVLSESQDNLIVRDERTEVYAEGVGLVYRDYTTLNFCAREDCLGQGIIESGQVLRLNIVEYGKE